jgi:hypothetical protein
MDEESSSRATLEPRRSVTTARELRRFTAPTFCDDGFSGALSNSP